MRPVASRHRAFQPLASSKGFGSEEDAAAQQNGKVRGGRGVAVVGWGTRHTKQHITADGATVGAGVYLAVRALTASVSPPRVLPPPPPRAASVRWPLTTVQVNARGKVSSRPGPVSPSAAPAKAPTAGDLIASPSSSSSSPPTTTGSPAPRSSVAAAAVRSTPQAVVDRIFGRMLLFSGVPVFLGLAALPLFYFLKARERGHEKRNNCAGRRAGGMEGGKTIDCRLFW